MKARKTAKMITSLFLAAALVFTAISLGIDGFPEASANSYDYDEKYGNFSYWTSGNTATISGYNENASGAVVIPETINGYKVTAIDWNAFSWCENITSVSVPATVKTIRSDAFYGCSSLTTIYLADGIEDISSYAFEGCAYYENSSNWINGVLYIGNYAICSDNNKVPSVLNIKSGTKVICSGCFEYNDTIETVVIPDSVEIIGDYAFYGCENIENLTIGSNVSYMGYETGCPAFGKTIANVTVSSSNTNYCFENGVLYNKDKTTIYFSSENLSNSTISIPSTVTEIMYNAFSGNTAVQQVVLPSSIKTIKNEAFYGCTNLRYANIPSSVAAMGSSVFSGCTALESITVPQSIGMIPDCTFEGCSGLTSVTIEDGITSIGYSAFDGCSSLRAITIPESVVEIDNYAFYGCSSLATITYGSDLNDVGYGVLYNTAYANNAGNYVNGILYLGNVAVDSNDSLRGSVTVKDGTTSIHEGVFYDNQNVTSVAIPDTVTEITYAQFENCTSLTSVSLPDNLQSIGGIALYNTAFYNNSSNWTGNALYVNNYLIKVKDSVTGTFVVRDGTKLLADESLLGCESLKTAVIPEGISFIPHSTFAYCFALKSIYFPASLSELDYHVIWGWGKNFALTDVYYAGSAQQASAVDKGISNEPITEATWHYNSTYTGDATDDVYTITATINAKSGSVSYGTNVVLKATASGVPTGYYVAIYDGNSIVALGDNSSVARDLGKMTSSRTYTVKIVDASGNVQYDANGNTLQKDVTISVNSGFFAVIIALIRSLFGITSSATIQP